MASGANETPTQTAAAGGATLLRWLPSIDECIRAAQERPSLEGLSHAYLKSIVTNAQNSIRKALVDGRYDFPGTRDALLNEIIRRTQRAYEGEELALTAVINATGVVLHTNLGRAILSETAIEAVDRAARQAVNLEYDLDQGGRGDRDALVERELCAITGAEAATVVNNNAAAVLLALTALAEGREVIVSRGELIEIGGSFRLPDIMAGSGARLREVGTTNRTHPRDYQEAIGPGTALLLKVHTSNYRVVGFTSAVTLEELVAIGRTGNIPVMEDLGSGTLVDLSAYGLPHEPEVSKRVAAGADLVTFSGDKLMGGPQAGIIVGKSQLLRKLKGNALRRALRCDKLTLAALSATLWLYLHSKNLASELPTLRFLKRRAGEIRDLAPRARDILLDRLGTGFQVEIVDTTSRFGSGALPTEELQSVALRINHPTMSANAIAQLFRRARPPVIGRIKDDAFQLDLRMIEDPSVLAVSFPSP